MAVLKVDITSRKEYAEGQSFGSTGPYERIDGIVTFAVDPENTANASIVDLGLAPRDEEGLVQFSSDFTLLTPTESNGHGKLLVDVINRGRKVAINTFNRVPPAPAPTREQPPGDGFLFSHGFSVVSVGWQWDIYRSDALLGLQAPPVEIDAGSVTGQAVVEIRPNALQHTWLLANRLHQPYPVADLDGRDSRLLVRDWEDGPETEIPRAAYRFAQEDNGRVVPSREHVYFESGFQPGKIYRIVYTAAVVVGAGLLAIREAAIWLRHPSPLNPIEGGCERAYAYGVSQTGRLLRHFLYLGLNLNEEGRKVYDGLLPHVAGGRRGEFNHRFGQPSQQSETGFGHMFPFADEEVSDPLTEGRDGLLNRQRELGAMPKVVYTNSSAEYWRGDGSLAHIDPPGVADMPQAPETRSYHFAGTQHGAGLVPQRSDAGPDGSKGRYPFNVVDYRPLLRAALTHLDRWAAGKAEPPLSRHPRLDDGSAVTRAEALDVMPSIPGLVNPDAEKLWVIREVDLPVGTHAGWNPRDPETGASEQLIPMQGFTLFFAPTKSAREESGDIRLSLEERYAGREEYLARVRELAEGLVEERYVLPEDVEIVTAACADRYDAAVEAGARSLRN